MITLEGWLFTKLLTIVILGWWNCRWWFYFMLFAAFSPFHLNQLDQSFHLRFFEGSNSLILLFIKPCLNISDSLGLGWPWNLHLWQVLRDADAAGPDTTLWEPLFPSSGQTSWLHVRNMESLWFFFVFLINFYWSMVAWQCCVSFHCTTKWISHTHTDIPSLLDFPPI